MTNAMTLNTIIPGDALTTLLTLPDNSVDCCVTSPPYYGLRDYGVSGQIGLEETPEAYIERLVAVFMEVYRMLKKSGTLWIVIGDSYNGSGKNGGNTCKKEWKQHTNTSSHSVKPTFVPGLKHKDLIGVPWMLAFALCNAGWYLRQDIIWSKNNPMPESVKDRCTKAHEYIFLLSKSITYYFNHEEMLEPAKKKGTTGLHDNHHGNNIPTYPMRHKRSVWSVNTSTFPNAHFATYPPELIAPCIKAGCPENGVVLDPFMGAGTTAVVARKLNRNFIGIELNPEYIKIANKRLRNELGIWQ